MMIITDVGVEDGFYLIKDDLIGCGVVPIGKPEKQTYGEKGYVTGLFTVYGFYEIEKQDILFFAIKYGNKRNILNDKSS